MVTCLLPGTSWYEITFVLWALRSGGSSTDVTFVVGVPNWLVVR